MDMVDDEPLYTTREERQVWSGLVSIGVSSALYCSYMAVALTRAPVAEISWVPPMFWSMFAGLVGTIIVAIVLEIVVAVRRPEDEKVAVDVRDREIGRQGKRLATPLMGAGLAVVLFLAALGAHDFWIANVAFLSGLLAAVAEAVIRLRLYRRGF